MATGPTVPRSLGSPYAIAPASSAPAGLRGERGEEPLDVHLATRRADMDNRWVYPLDKHLKHLSTVQALVLEEGQCTDLPV
jgi:hypothetical protein